MKRNSYLAIFLGLGCSALIFGLITNSISTSPKALTPIVYMDAQVQYLRDMVKKGEYYGVNPKLLAEANKIDLNDKLVSKASNNIFNELEDKISEAEDKTRLDIYYKTHTPEQNAQAKSLFEKAWLLNSQMHQAIKDKNNPLVLEIQTKFGEIETPIAAEIMKIVIPEVNLK